MTKKALRPTVSRHIQLYEDNWDYIEANFGRYSPSPVGTGKVIREIVNKHCRAMKAKQDEAMDEGMKEEGMKGEGMKDFGEITAEEIGFAEGIGERLGRRDGR